MLILALLFKANVSTVPVWLFPPYYCFIVLLFVPAFTN